MGAAFVIVLRKYCLSATQHGVRNLFLPNRTLLEKSIWLIIILVCACAIGVFLVVVYLEYVNQIILITTDDINSPVWNYDFPAVTICSVNKISKVRLDSFMKHLKDQTKNFTTATDHWRRLLWSGENTVDTPLDKFIQLNNLSSLDFMNAVSPDCSYIKKCRIKDALVNCKDIFLRTLTVHGYCCSYNYFALKAKSLNDEPVKMSQCSYRLSLQFFLEFTLEDYAAFYWNFAGVTLFLHNPYSFLDLDNEAVYLGQSTTNFISISPESTTISDDFKPRPLSERNCKFTDEEDVEGFNRYTYINCLTDCRMKIMLKKCGCVPFYYAYQNRSKICKMKDLSCTYDLQDIFQRTNETMCNCYQSCDDIQYTISSSTVSLKEALTHNSYIGSEKAVKSAININLYFNNLAYAQDSRNMKYNLLETMASLGGILGLFNGISIITLIEIFYWFIIKYTFMVCNRDMNKKNKCNLAPTRIFVVESVNKKQ